MAYVSAGAPYVMRRMRVMWLSSNLDVVARFTRSAVQDGRVDQGTAAPTVVLVHGAFEDPSSWWAVVKGLKARGIAASAKGVPRSGLSADARYLRSALGGAGRPLLLVGHSYGGAVITVAADGLDQVVGLVYVAGLIPDVGETSGGLLAPIGAPPAERGCRGMRLVRDARPQDATWLTDDRAVTEPVSACVLGEAASAAAWRALPSWAIVASEDPAIDAEAQRFMAARAGAPTTEVQAAHAIAVSHPCAVVDVIVAAVHDTWPRSRAATRPGAVTG